MRILLIGGSKSGKSGLAQNIVRTLAGGAPLLYWATMEPADSEDRARIARHVSERAGCGFQTLERGRDLPAALESIDARSAVLLDSVTALLANEMFGGGVDTDAGMRVESELKRVSRAPAHFVCVCDDIWRDGYEYAAQTEEYRRSLAAICRALAAEFDAVAEVTAGRAKFWKGTI
jgi:adenosylcobinamide kinase/adenosylcobinamide-phosphate guanylyltransferase